MTREEVKVEFTGLAHDHLMASSRIQSVGANTLHHHHNPSQINNTNHHTFGCLSSIQDKTNIPTADTGAATDSRHALSDQDDPIAAQKQETAAASTTGRRHSHQAVDALSTIAILRRHPMYDSLVLVKKYRTCLKGYTLEFPTSQVDSGDDDCYEPASGKRLSQSSIVPQIFNQQPESTNTAAATAASDSENDGCRKEHEKCCGRTKLVSVYLDGDDPIYQSQAASMKRVQKAPALGAASAEESNDIVYVPVNGLLDRLNNYDQQGISIDSRVYAFAMGLKTAERFLTSSAEKEIQEAPPL